MADLRIVDAPEIPTENITGEEKLPTGGNGNYSISLDSLADYTKTKKDLADNTSVDTKVGGVRQELDSHIEDLLNPHQVTKGQIGLGNVDNTADADKPVSNSAQAAIISAVSPKADKTYVDSQLVLKASKVDVDSSLLTKSDKTYVDDRLALKTDKTYTDSQDSALQYQIDQKATAEYLDSALDEQTQTVNTALSNLSTLASKFYPTLAEANADIVNISVNQPIQVGESGANGGLWYKSTTGATTLTKSPHDPLTQAKNYTDTKTDFVGGSDYAFSINDMAGNTALAVKDNGHTEVVALDISEASIVENIEYAWSVEDSNGNVALAVGNDGTVYAASIVTNDSDRDSLDLEEAQPFANIQHIECFGQSLSLGAYSQPPLSTTQNYNNIMFQGGVSNQHPQNSSIDFRGGFVPLKEAPTDDGWYPIGETPLTPSTDMIRQLLSAEDGVEYTEQDLKFLGTASGEGGMNIAHLASTEYPTNLKPNISSAYNLSQAAGKTYAMPAMYWVQGESDNNASQTIANYKTSAKALFSSINDYVKSVNNQVETVQVISTQLANPKYGNLSQPKVEIALYELANELDYFHLACPLYIFDYVDNAHLDNVSSRITGGYLGLVYKRVVFDKKEWSHIKPISHRVQGKITEVKFHVPVKPLVFDTDRVTLNTNYGFSLVDASGNAIAISVVTLSQDDTVKVVATTNIPVGAKLRYAFSPVDGLGRVNGTRGNLRDSQGDAIKFHDFAMHNWTPIFEYTLA